MVVQWTATDILSVLWCLLASYTDIRYRVIRNWHVIILGAVCIAGSLSPLASPSFSWTAVLLAGFLCLLGGLPGGDVKGIMLLAGLLGVERTVAVFVVALIAGVFAFALYRLRWLPYPGTWPLFPFFAVPACAIVLML